MSAPVRPDYDLFHQPPEPPSGPPTDVREFEAGHAGYVAWKATELGWRAWRYMEAMALDLAARRELRIGAKALVEQARRNLTPKVEINNNWTCLIADDLVARHPHLEELIERRKRKSAA